MHSEQTLASVSGGLVLIFVGVPLMFYAVKFSLAFLKELWTIESRRPLDYDEVDGMYVEVNGQVRVDD